jgi:sorbitol/mannitol transport system permease protein
MARKTTAAKTAVTTGAAWLVGFVIFFPILWMA